MMRRILFSLFWITPFILVAQSPKETSFQAAIKDVVQQLAKRDSVGLLKYTDKAVGVYILYRIGVQDHIKHIQRIGFSDSNYPHAPFYDAVHITKLNYATLPVFDCNKWTKTGTFVDTNRIDRLLSKTARRWNLYQKKKIPQKTIDSYLNLESLSRRVVIADKNGNDLIFYLSFINNKWYLTMIDKITTDCSV